MNKRQEQITQKEKNNMFKYEIKFKNEMPFLSIIMEKIIPIFRREIWQHNFLKICIAFHFQRFILRKCLCIFSGIKLSKCSSH